MNLDAFLKSYFTFSKGERRASFLLLALIGSTLILPHLWTDDTFTNFPSPNEDSVKRVFEEQALALVQANTVAQEGKYSSSKVNPNTTSTSSFSQAFNSTLFVFDPNTVGKEDLLRLGFSPKTATILLNFRNKGAVFHRPEDLKRVYGVTDELFDRLQTYIHIAKPSKQTQDHFKDSKPTFDHAKHGNNTDNFVANTHPTTSKTLNQATGVHPSTSMPKTSALVELNTADSLNLVRVSGIGAYFAKSILKYRRLLGGFVHKDQLLEVWGMNAEKFQVISKYVQAEPSLVKRININTADVATLGRHPYIKYPLAKVIVAYRTEHGSFKSVEDLQKIQIITPEQFTKFKPYLTIDN